MKRVVSVAVCVAILGTNFVAGEEGKVAPPPSHPKIVLVLSGGGARGSAHIGVLKKLEEYHVPVDMIVGTSMGSIVGGLYAAGWSVDEIEAKITTIDWGTVFVDRLPRQFRTFRRKTDDARFLVPIKMRFKGFKPYIPPAVLGGQSMELLFQGLELDATGERNFDNFPIPYRAVATDLATGDAFVIGEGSLATAMRASMSVPGLFPPVEMNGHPLADGGMAANLPVRIAQKLGAEVVIAVDISSPLRGKDELGNLLTRVDQTTSLLTNLNKNDDMKALRPQDVLMVPALDDIKFSDFSRAAEAIKAGIVSAEGKERRLKALAASDAEWSAYVARHRRRPQSDLIVDELHIKNDGPLNDAIVNNFIQVPLHEPLDSGKLAKQVLHLYSLDAYGPIHHDFFRENGKGILAIEAPRKPYGRNSLQFGFNLTDDFRGDSGFNLSLSHLMNPVNRLGGEWRNLFQLGENFYVATQFYQPFGAAMKWFIRPGYELRRDKVRQYDDDGNALAEYRIGGQILAVDGGRVLGNWGEVAIGAFRSSSDGRPKVGDITLPTFTSDDGGLDAKFRVDTLDTVTWPRDGVHTELEYKRSLESLGADRTGDNFSISAGAAGTIGKNVLYGSVELEKTVPFVTNLSNAYFLGGFLRLSGLAQNQLVGNRGGLARLLYYRELGAFNLGSLTQRMYLGGSLEMGNAYAVSDPVTWASLRGSASVFAGADTVVGPAYLGFGYAEGGRKSVYLIIGQRF